MGKQTPSLSEFTFAVKYDGNKHFYCLSRQFPEYETVQDNLDAVDAIRLAVSLNCEVLLAVKEANQKEARHDRHDH